MTYNPELLLLLGLANLIATFLLGVYILNEWMERRQIRKMLRKLSKVSN